ncbi:GntP family permease [Telluribacter sp. SYSU D00476]|uniref:GntP family permease n=1 Tax=Telluribacter sp. SYSU D00476 TaxID=2811430 RepID=UPI001FF28C0E|nr:gluconate:H+ symporter [Telluribacter sp. SYSU D00476]
MSSLPVPIVGLVVAVGVLIFLVLRTRVHALIAMLIAASIAGLVGGMSADKTVSVITQGFGTTLGSIGIVIGLGVMMGRIMEVSGAGEQIAYSLIRWLGKRKEEWAMVITGYLVSIPIFVDSAFVILYPVAKALAQRSRRSLLTLGVALAGGLVITHSAVPPTPGPLGVAGLFGVDVGSMLLLGMALALPCAVGVVLYALWLATKYPHFDHAAPVGEELKTIHQNYLQDRQEKPLPGLMLSLLPIVVPIVLIFLKALLTTLAQLPGQEGLAEQPLVQVLYFVGSPIIALSISTLLAVYTLVPELDRASALARLEEGLQSAGIILMVTGAGGALGAVVRESGAGSQLAAQVAGLPISPVMIPFIVSTLVRLIQGSGTVAMITAASISAPILAQIPGVNMLLAAQAAAMGSLFFSYFNDSLFWVVNRLMGIVEIRQQLAVWSVTTTIAWAIGGSCVALLNLFVGSGGTLLDPFLPLLVAGVILLVVRR